MLKVDEDHLELGAIPVVLVHFSPTLVSHARKNIIYSNDMHHHIIIKDMITYLRMMLMTQHVGELVVDAQC